MTSVQVAWLTLILGPIAVAALAVGRSASKPKPGKPVPGWAKGLQAAGIAVALLVAFMQMLA